MKVGFDLMRRVWRQYPPETGDTWENNNPDTRTALTELFKNNPHLFPQEEDTQPPQKEEGRRDDDGPLYGEKSWRL